MHAAIEREVQEFLQKNPCARKGEFLNNFFFRLPDKGFEMGGFYRMARKKKWNVKNKDILPSQSHAEHSEVYLNQTPEQFFATIDELVLECGLSVETIHEIMTNSRRRAELNEYAFPVYERLRALGYNHNELIS